MVSSAAPLVVGMRSMAEIEPETHRRSVEQGFNGAVAGGAQRGDDLALR
jgi:hypothetical protein